MPKVNRRRIETVIAALVAVGAGAVGIANHEAARGLGPKFVSVERIASIKNPVFLTQPPGPGSQLFVAQAGGTIRVISDDRLRRRPFLNISDRVDARGVRGEPGMASIAFPPDYQRSRQFYVAYSRRNALIVARYRRSATDPLLADPGSGQTILQIHEPTAAHHGGLLAFGPDGHLYIATGDGGPRRDPKRSAQNLQLLRGKILRIDVDHGDPYTVPSDNPFGNEIWDFGLRNPWRFSFDKGSGDLFIGVVGQDAWEEVDYEAKGQGGVNYGWNFREGSHVYHGQPPATENLVYPVAEYSHASSHCSVTGGYVYRGAMPEWQGIYLYGDYCSGEIWGMIRDTSSETGWTSQVLFNTGENITTFGQDPGGEVYYAGRGGTIYRLEK
jgi:glucose/arabinose dehydrogenase